MSSKQSHHTGEKLLKAQNEENQAWVQGLMRPWWSAAEKPPGRKQIFLFFTANIGALLAPARQKCKQEQVSQRWKKRLEKRIFCSLESLHESYTLTLSASGDVHIHNVKIKISLSGDFQKAEFCHEVEKFHACIPPLPHPKILSCTKQRHIHFLFLVNVCTHHSFLVCLFAFWCLILQQ